MTKRQTISQKFAQGVLDGWSNLAAVHNVTNCRYSYLGTKLRCAIGINLTQLQIDELGEGLQCEPITNPRVEEIVFPRGIGKEQLRRLAALQLAHDNICNHYDPDGRTKKLEQYRKKVEQMARGEDAWPHAYLDMCGHLQAG